jgi:hypothetical protein
MLWMLLAGCVSPTLDGQAWGALDLWPGQPDTSCRTTLSIGELVDDGAGVAWGDSCGSWLGQARRLCYEGPSLDGEVYLVQASGAGQAMAYGYRWEVVPAPGEAVEVRIWDGERVALESWDDSPGNDWGDVVRLEPR